MNRKACRYISHIVLFALLLSALCLLCGCAQRVTIEAGQSITPADLTGDASAVFGADFDPSCVNHAGTHTFYGVTLHLHNPSSVRNHFVIVRYQTEAVAARLGDEHPIKWIVVNVRQIRYIDTMSRPHG